MLLLERSLGQIVLLKLIGHHGFINCLELLLFDLKCQIVHNLKQLAPLALVCHCLHLDLLVEFLALPDGLRVKGLQSGLPLNKAVEALGEFIEDLREVSGQGVDSLHLSLNIIALVLELLPEVIVGLL